jgi:hypothetical protein
LIAHKHTRIFFTKVRLSATYVCVAGHTLDDVCASADAISRDGRMTSGPPMSRMIVYTCPKTGRDVPLGVLTDDDSFAQLPHERVTVKCAECGDLHEYWTSEARLAVDPPDKKPTNG